MRRIILAAALIAGSAGLFTAAPAQAAQACGHVYECWWTWYSDTQQGREVGGQLWACNGVFTQWGTQSDILQYIQEPCAA